MQSSPPMLVQPHEAPCSADAAAYAVSRWASVRVALGIFAASRLLFLLISFLVSRLLSDTLGRVRSLAALWGHWDVRWYIQIADHGYHWHPLPAQSDLAFFPLYPLTMHVLTAISPLSAYSAGVLVANLSCAVALYLLHRLVTRDFDAEVAERSVLYLAFFPTALFLVTAYSESLYLAWCLACVYALRLHRWWIAGLCGMAASLTRQLGLLLLLPFVIEYWGYRMLRREQAADHNALAGLLIPGGLLIFMAYLQVTLGNGLLFLRAQAAWQRSLAPPWQGVALSLRHILHPATPKLALQTLNILDLSFLVFFLALVVVGSRRLPRSYTAYAAAVWLAILITPATGARQPLALLSVSRFGLTLFPSFITLALLSRRRMVDQLLLALFVGLLVIFTIIFLRGRWLA